MVLQMPRPQVHPKTGVYRARRAVPADLRTILGKRELIETLGTKDRKEALRLFPAVMERMEARLAAARAQRGGHAVIPTPRQIAQLARVVYDDQVAIAEADPGDPEVRDAWLDVLRDRLSNPTEAHRLEAASLLAAHGFSAGAETVRPVADALPDAKFTAESVGLMRARGDWSPSPYASRFPSEPPVATPPPAAAPPPEPVLTFEGLYDLYEQQAAVSERTLIKQRGAIKHLAKAAGHNDARRVGESDVHAMKTARLAANKHRKTINADIAVLGTMWKCGAKNGQSPKGFNPFSDTLLAVPHGPPPRRRFSDIEASTILTATRSESGTFRWLPWLLALTGCRLGEAVDAMAADIRRERGVWVLDLHAGRCLKNPGSQRFVPLHPALSDERFLAYVHALQHGSALFPLVTVGANGTLASIATKVHGRWVHELNIGNGKAGVGATKVAPAHG